MGLKVWVGKGKTDSMADPNNWEHVRTAQFNSVDDGGVKGMSKETNTPGEQALDRFLAMNSRGRQWEALRELGVTSPDEEKRKDVLSVFQMAFRRIASRGLQTEFWDAMNKHFGDWYENPFVYRDMLSAIESPSNVKQNIHCPQCGRQWRIRSEHAVAVCKYGRCVKCLKESEIDYFPESLLVFEIHDGVSKPSLMHNTSATLERLADADRGFVSKSQIIAEHAEAWKKPGDVKQNAPCSLCGVKSRSAVDIEGARSLKDEMLAFRAAGLDDRSKRQRLDEAAAVIGYRPGDLDALALSETIRKRAELESNVASWRKPGESLSQITALLEADQTVTEGCGVWRVGAGLPAPSGSSPASLNKNRSQGTTGI